MFSTCFRAALAAAVFAVSCLGATAQAQTPSRNLAPGFTARIAGSKLVIVPPDVELFSQSAGGVLEPKADWTEAAQRHFRTALMAQKSVLAGNSMELGEKDMDELAQLNVLHGAVAEAVFVHHMLSMPDLPTKEKRLDWTLGDAVQPLRDKTGADYALFFWVRDSYATAERKAAMVAMTILGAAVGVVVVPTGGQQIAYASLVDLRDGRVVWFNNLNRMAGDLREAQPALETVQTLLKTFPAAK
ncbi:MAG TPA: hypothetical protein VNB23_15345 [Ramlibacter sp.]|nr:hypothetical protein [Ramlibacter sp.]